MENNTTEALEKAKKFDNEAIELYVNTILSAKAENKEESEKLLLQMIEKYPDSPYFIAITYASIGDNAKTMDWLEKAYAFKDKELVFVYAEPKFKSIRNTSRFKHLIKQMDFPK